MDDAKDLFGLAIEVIQGVEKTLPAMGTTLSTALVDLRDGKLMQKASDEFAKLMEPLATAI